MLLLDEKGIDNWKYTSQKEKLTLFRLETTQGGVGIAHQSSRTDLWWGTKFCVCTESVLREKLSFRNFTLVIKMLFKFLNSFLLLSRI